MRTLNDSEIRVLAVLIEKSLSHPTSYPLTINALLLGANQKQNREPVVEYTEGDVSRALQGLIVHRIAEQAPPSAGARANRFAHRVVDVFGWDRREQAVMAELMLRGRQTAGELRARASRMTPLTDVGAVDGILRTLMERDPLHVEELPREPGRSANRFRHLLGQEPDQREAAATVAAAPASPSTPARDATAPVPTNVIDVTARLDRLEQTVADIAAELAVLRRSTSQSTGLGNDDGV
jgi:hypothetical protein